MSFYFTNIFIKHHNLGQQRRIKFTQKQLVSRNMFDIIYNVIVSQCFCTSVENADYDNCFILISRLLCLVRICHYTVCLLE